MKYCTRCVYPANAKPLIIFDEHGVCSGCRNIESRKDYNENHVDWVQKKKN